MPLLHEKHSLILKILRSFWEKLTAGRQFTLLYNKKKQILNWDFSAKNCIKKDMYNSKSC